MTVKRMKYWCVAAGVFAPVMFTSMARAIPLGWGAPQQISGDSDVSKTGTLVYAYNTGDGSATNETVNGVTFTAFNCANTATATTTGASISGIDPNFNGAGNYAASGLAPFSSLSASYQGLLGQIVFGKAPGEAGGPVNLVLTLSGLTPGATYLFQTFADDSRGGQGGSSSTRSETVSDGTNTSASLFYNSVPPVEGGLGHYAIDTFVATTPMETFTYVGDPTQGDSQINAFQLRLVPEPGTLALMGFGLIGLMARRRK